MFCITAVQPGTVQNFGKKRTAEGRLKSLEHECYTKLQYEPMRNLTLTCLSAKTIIEIRSFPIIWKKFISYESEGQRSWD